MFTFSHTHTHLQVFVGTHNEVNASVICGRMTGKSVKRSKSKSCSLEGCHPTLTIHSATNQSTRICRYSVQWLSKTSNVVMWGKMMMFVMSHVQNDSQQLEIPETHIWQHYFWVALVPPLWHYQMGMQYVKKVCVLCVHVLECVQGRRHRGLGRGKRRRKDISSALKHFIVNADIYFSVVWFMT